jgi:hypothetical protein
MSQSIATQVPLTVRGARRAIELRSLLVPRGVGAEIDFIVLFLLLFVPEAILAQSRRRDGLNEGRAEPVTRSAHIVSDQTAWTGAIIVPDMPRQLTGRHHYPLLCTAT